MLDPREQLCPPEPPVEDIGEVVRAVVAEVLETMFFSEAVASGCGGRSGNHNWLSSAVAVRVPFEGSHSGEMRLAATLNAADSIACAFLGADVPELAETSRNEVILELANVLCGAILSHLWPESKLALGPPELLAPDDSPCRFHDCFELPEGRLAIWIEWSKGAGGG